MRFSPRPKPKGVFSSLTLRTDGIASRTGASIRGPDAQNYATGKLQPRWSK